MWQLALAALVVVLILLVLRSSCVKHPEGYAAKYTGRTSSGGYDPIGDFPQWSGGVRPRTLISKHPSVRYERGPMV